MAKRGCVAWLHSASSKASLAATLKPGT